jgi:endonuclease/exonuclease/phosphatase family metal-dependent hydrolase
VNKTKKNHLEAFAEPFRFAQAQELVATFANETLPVVMLGDFNTNNPSPPSPYNDATYQFMTQTAGYYDTWEYNLFGNQNDGMTYGHASNLLNPLADLYARIDFVFVGNTAQGTGQHPIGPVYAEIIGDEQSDRTPSGLWPSDHAGIIARLHISSAEQLADY